MATSPIRTPHVGFSAGTKTNTLKRVLQRQLEIRAPCIYSPLATAEFWGLQPHFFVVHRHRPEHRATENNPPDRGSAADVQCIMLIAEAYKREAVV